MSGILAAHVEKHRPMKKNMLPSAVLLFDNGFIKGYRSKRLTKVRNIEPKY
jgi:hypothetical protein